LKVQRQRVDTSLEPNGKVCSPVAASHNSEYKGAGKFGTGSCGGGGGFDLSSMMLIHKLSKVAGTRKGMCGRVELGSSDI